MEFDELATKDISFIEDDDPKYNSKVLGKVLSKVKTGENGCLEWDGFKDKDGYGRLSVGGREDRKHFLAHRWTFEFSTRIKLPNDVEVCHHCDNSSCIHPSHLYPGSHAENMGDKKDRGRGIGLNHFHKLTDEQIKDIQTSDKSAIELANEHGVHRSHIYRIKKSDET